MVDIRLVNCGRYKKTLAANNLVRQPCDFFSFVVSAISVLLCERLSPFWTFSSMSLVSYISETHKWHCTSLRVTKIRWLNLFLSSRTEYSFLTWEGCFNCIVHPVWQFVSQIFYTHERFVSQWRMNILVEC